MPGYFCPLGTAASLTVDGEFGDGIHMVPRAILIERIAALLERNRAWLATFDADAASAEYASLQAQLAREEAKLPRN